MEIHTFQSLAECSALKEAWNAIVRQNARTIDGLDVTATFDWTSALCDNFLPDQPQKVIVLQDGGDIVGVLPFFERKTKATGFVTREISPIVELYGRRGGFVVKDNSPSYLEKMFEFLYELKDWDTLTFTIVDGGAFANAFEQMVQSRGYVVDILSKSYSPCVSLTQDWDSYFSQLDPKFRYNFKNREKKLKQLGSIKFKIYETKEVSTEFIDAMLQIERRSWKEKAGTSITTNLYQERFYKLFTPRAVENGWFLGLLLTVNDVPIAHTYGIVFENIFYNLKISYDESYKAISPGHLITGFTIRELYRRGVAIYDFHGNPEWYKMKWANMTYSKTHYVMYNKTWRARLARMKLKLGQLIKAKRSATAINSSPGKQPSG